MNEFVGGYDMWGEYIIKSHPYSVLTRGSADLRRFVLDVITNSDEMVSCSTSVRLNLKS